MDFYESVNSYCLRQEQETGDEDNIHLPPGFGLPTMTLQELWNYINSFRVPSSVTKVCNILLIAEAVLGSLQQTKPANLKEMEGDKKITRLAFAWVSASILPKKEFSGVWEEFQLADGPETERRAIHKKYRMHRLRSALGLSVLVYLDMNIHLDWLVDPGKVIGVLSAFVDKNDPWTTDATRERASKLIQLYKSRLPTTHEFPQDPLADVLQDILLNLIRPLFSLRKDSQRDNQLHQPNWASKPWKYGDLYIVSVLSWLIKQYESLNRVVLDSHFSLLMPTLLALIDDDSLAYKARGCNLLCHLAQSLKGAGSILLRKSNIDSVFLHSLLPCLHFIPTTTPENESIHLLRAAYPALFTVIRAGHPDPFKSPPPQAVFLPRNQALKQQAMEETKLRETCLVNVMRDYIIHTYQHISSPRPSEDTSISSYPYPRLSTFILNQLAIAMTELGIDTGKYIQYIVPILTPTLANPFGTAYVPLLDAASKCTRAVLINGWPRVWRWRGEILAGLCGCWLHLGAEDDDTKVSIVDLRRDLKEVAGLLKVVIKQKTDFVAIRQTIDIDAEYQQLVNSDERLRDLLLDA